jgi:hypothetical protein
MAWVEHGEFDDEVDDDELGNAISQSSCALSRQNNRDFPCARHCLLLVLAAAAALVL